VTTAPAVSIVLPTYNEVGNIVPLVRELLAPGDDREVLVVDDASPDGTAAAVRDAFGADPRVRLIERTSDRGLARSVLCGLGHARSDKLVMMDSDFNHNPSVVPVMADLLRHFDLVVGSRFVAGGGMQNEARYYGSWTFNILIRALLGTRIQDNLSGFFAIRRPSFERFDQGAVFFGYGDYFFRLLEQAVALEMAIVEVPVFYEDRTSGSSKSNLVGLLRDYASAVVKYAAQGHMRKRPISHGAARRR
jgi:dolichol-phosphate mannosyltransferase